MTPSVTTVSTPSVTTVSLGDLFPSSSIKLDVGPASGRVHSVWQSSRNGSLIIDVHIFQRNRGLSGVKEEHPITKRDDVVAALKENGGLKLWYDFGVVNVGSITLPMKLLSIESDFSHGPYEPVYDVLRFTYESQHHA